MPIYEYESLDVRRGCERCRRPFEILQSISDAHLTRCPSCGRPVRRTISLVRVVLAGGASGRDRVEQEVADYERKGMWSHAAELADKVSEKPERAHLKERAMENYRRAGYDV